MSFLLFNTNFFLNYFKQFLNQLLIFCTTPLLFFIYHLLTLIVFSNYLYFHSHIKNFLCLLILNFINLIIIIIILFYYFNFIMHNLLLFFLLYLAFLYLLDYLLINDIYLYCFIITLITWSDLCLTWYSICAHLIVVTENHFLIVHIYAIG